MTGNSSKKPTKEEGRQKKVVDWVLPAITIAMVAIVAVMLFLQRNQMVNMENLIKEITEYIRAVR